MKILYTVLLTISCFIVFQAGYSSESYIPDILVENDHFQALRFTVDQTKNRRVELAVNMPLSFNLAQKSSRSGYVAFIFTPEGKKLEKSDESIIILIDSSPFCKLEDYIKFSPSIYFLSFYLNEIISSNYGLTEEYGIPVAFFEADTKAITRPLMRLKEKNRLLNGKNQIYTFKSMQLVGKQVDVIYQIQYPESSSEEHKQELKKKIKKTLSECKITTNLPI